LTSTHLTFKGIRTQKGGEITTDPAKIKACIQKAKRAVSLELPYKTRMKPMGIPLKREDPFAESNSWGTECDHLRGLPPASREILPMSDVFMDNPSLLLRLGINLQPGAPAKASGSWNTSWDLTVDRPFPTSFDGLRFNPKPHPLIPSFEAMELRIPENPLKIEPPDSVSQGDGTSRKTRIRIAVNTILYKQEQKELPAIEAQVKADYEKGLGLVW
jgi:hypothetical protein